MHARFAQSVLLTVAGAFVLVASQVFAVTTSAWIAFAFGAFALVLSAVPLVAGVRGRALVLDATTAVLAAWTIVASLVFAGSTVRWLSFGEGAALAGLGLIGLAVDHIHLAREASGAVPSTSTETVTSVDRRAPVAA
jgi:hypothetical protein